MTWFNSELVPEFAKDRKSCPASDEDFEVFEKAFGALKLRLPELYQIPGLVAKKVTIPIYKAKGFRCKAINKGSRSGVRVIFAYLRDQDLAIYIETYTKNEQDNHDEKRILRYFREKTAKDFLAEVK